MTIVVLHGYVPPDAPKDELDTLVEVENVSSALGRLGYEPVSVPFSLDTKAVLEVLRELRPIIVFNLVECLEGSGQLIHIAPTLLDHLGFTYTGASAETIFLSSNKLVAKNLLHKAGIPTPPWVSSCEESGLDSIVFGPPYIIKSVWEHASIGLDEDSVVFDKHRLRQEVELRMGRHAGACYVESYVEGREFNLSLLEAGRGMEVLPPAEIHFVDYPKGKPRVVGYRAKWEEESFEYQHTPRSFTFPDRDKSLLRRLADIAVECWHVFGFRGYVRMDFRVDSSGRPWVLELNANPCLSPEGGFASAAEQGGLSYDGLIGRIVEVPLRKAGGKSPS